MATHHDVLVVGRRLAINCIILALGTNNTLYRFGQVISVSAPTESLYDSTNS